jgi:hypothetical protein
MGLLHPTHSPYNTPILPAKKAQWVLLVGTRPPLSQHGSDPIHPMVPNPYPYPLLSLIPGTTTHFTVLDLKDAFFTIPVHHGPKISLPSPGLIQILILPNN